MAHNLAHINGRVAMAYQGETPWHQLGTRIAHGTDIGAALAAASLDWRVGLEWLYLKDGRPLANRRAVVRDVDREILGTVSGWYQPIQNADAFGVFAEAVTECGLTVEAAGALGTGATTWMLFRLPATMSPVAGDEIHGYGLAVNAHDGSHAFEFRPTPIRVVCQNTLNVAVGAGGDKGRVFGVSHIGEVADRVAQAGTLVKDVLAAMRQTGDTFAALARRKMTPAEIVRYIEHVFPSADNGDVSQRLAERRARVAELVWSGVGSELAMSGTNGEPNAWAAYQGVTEYVDHVVTGQAKTATAQRRVNASAVFGRGATVKLAALRQAQRLVAA